ncbi:MAG: 3-methyl-2-oxobutanoate hydroxymethyltransferase, partial [Candidatus Omnitrophica bacterium]|nr:3-methyl-2-oxobutanoate hydroxymethyltransferase [Candidatus Omnitrophota bacterium]
MREDGRVSLFREKQSRGEKITMLTCYDYSFARALDGSGVDAVLVGDSLANVVLGLPQTREISFEEMRAHTRAVRRGIPEGVVLADMPACSVEAGGAQAVRHARELAAAGADAVKIEWGDCCRAAVRAVREAGIPVMGHVGLTPQTV